MIVMVTEGVKDVNFFVAAQMMFTVLFGLLFYIFGVQTEGDDDYSQLSVWGTFLQTFREGLGDFGNVDGSTLSGSLLYSESVCWLILALMVFVIFSNFMLAQVGWTFERVKSEESIFYRFEVLSFIAEKIQFEDLMDVQLDPLIVFQEVDSSMAFKTEFGNDMPIIKGVVRNINQQITDLFKKMQRQFELQGKVQRTIVEDLSEV
jgi:hypothetical protein